MKYEVFRLWDATNFDGTGFVGYIEREEKIKVGSQLVPLPGEFKDDLEKEILTGKVNCVLRRWEYENPKPDSESRVGLEGVVNVKELAKKHNITEGEILDRYFYLSSEGRDKVFSESSGGVVLLDDIYLTRDRGNLGVIWRAGGELFIYDYSNGEVFYSTNPGLGIRYGDCGKRDFLNAVGQKEQLNFQDIVDAVGKIRDYDNYPREED